MKFRRKSLHAVSSLLCAALLVVLAGSLAFAGSYSFSVHNNSKSKITKVLVSEDGKTWGYFDIGKGIPPGATQELEWDESTEGEDCKQYFKAVFADGSESQPTKFDFCEKDLTLEFE